MRENEIEKFKLVERKNEHIENYLLIIRLIQKYILQFVVL